MEPTFAGEPPHSEPPHSPNPATPGAAPWTSQPPTPARWADLYVTPAWSHILSWCGMTIVLVGLGNTGRLLGTAIMLPGLACLFAVSLTTNRRLTAIWRQAVPPGTRVPGEPARAVAAAITAAAWAGFELYCATTHMPWWAVVLLAMVGALTIQTLTALLAGGRQAYLRGLDRHRSSGRG